MTGLSSYLVMKNGSMTRVPLFCAALVLANATAVDAQVSSPGIDKVLKWQGERVMILKSTQRTIFADCSRPRSDKDEPPYARYGGTTGVITNVAVRDDAPRRFQLTITQDGTGESIILCNDEPLGFFSELDSAKKLVAKPLWTKGQRLFRDTTGKTVLIHNTAKLTVTKVDWRNYATPIEVFFRTDDGLEGTLERSFVGQGYAGGFDERFHASDRGNGGPYLSQFYLEDPRRTHPNWTPTIWEIIRSGEVAVGMTLEMAEVACGTGFASEGVGLSQSGKAGRILRCEYSHHFFKRFEVLDGKVTRYVER